MTKTLWAIFWTTLYITYLGGIFPYLMLYLLILSSIRKSRNKEIVGKNLRNYGVPRELRRELKKSYSNTLSLSKMLKLADLQRTSKGKGFTIKLGSSSD
ncbi:MAG: hypothetical protein H7641_09495 [Candidatus Heimdallarchaeota archaeon]|nr:hypothetical protein [Candidatus Heimdallarchaeota archaeon]MCK4877797.1 hypothetical protein [Candidatus Heimdallarchaeota archaeon]